MSQSPLATPLRLPLPNTYWVVPGRFLAGEYPGAEKHAESVRRLQTLGAAGINYFLDLTQPDELPSYRQLLPAATKYLNHPIHDCEIPEDVTQMQFIQARIRAALTFGRCIYVHCRAGIGRTGTVVGCFLVEQGLEGTTAVEQLNVMWRQSARSKSWPKVPQTYQQEQYIERWATHRKYSNAKK
jgi:protein-tyrosine phosphatase